MANVVVNWNRVVVHRYFQHSYPKQSLQNETDSLLNNKIDFFKSSDLRFPFFTLPPSGSPD